MRLHIAVAMSCVAFTLTGCVLLPFVPLPPGGIQGRAIDDDSVSAIKVGSTTREEVLASWGEPTRKIDDELWYSWDHEGWSQIWLWPRIGKCEWNTTNYVVTLYFDERDRVRKIERSQSAGADRCHDFF